MGMVLATAQDTTSTLEFIKSLHWQGRHAVMLRAGVMSFMYRSNSVNNLRLNSLLVDDWLHSLVNVVVDMFASDGWGGSLSVSCFVCSGVILELAKLSRNARLSFVIVAVMNFAVLGREQIVSVLLRESLLVSDWLHSGVVMILMNLTFNSLSHLLMSVWLNGLTCDGWVDNLVHLGLVTLTGGELANGGFCGFHCEIWRLLGLW